jgi:hypothetical protein
MTTATPDPIALVVDDRARARAAGDPLVDLCVLATGGGAEAEGPPGVRPIVLRDVGPQGIGLLISRTSPKWAPLSSGCYELLLLWLTIRRQYRVPLLRDVRRPVDRRVVTGAVPRGNRSAAPAVSQL